MPLRKRVRVKLDCWSEFSGLTTDNVSEGGVFVEMEEAAEVGQRVSIEVSDAQGKAMVLPGEVAHVARDDGTRGIGVRFLALSDAEREIVEMLVGEARRFAEGSQNIPIMPREDHAILPMLRAQLREVELRDPFEVLGLPRSATHDSIRRAYDHQIERWHPSSFPDATHEEVEAAAAICRALAIVRDEALRGA